MAGRKSFAFKRFDSSFNAIDFAGRAVAIRRYIVPDDRPQAEQDDDEWSNGTMAILETAVGNRSVEMGTADDIARATANHRMLPGDRLLIIADDGTPLVWRGAAPPEIFNV